MLRWRSGAPFAGALVSILGTGEGKTGIDGAVVSFRGPPATVGVGAASYPSLKKEELANSACHGDVAAAAAIGGAGAGAMEGGGRDSPSKLDDLPPKGLLAQRWLPRTWAYPASTLVVLLLLLPLRPLEWRGARCEVSRMLLMRPRPGW